MVETMPINTTEEEEEKATTVNLPWHIAHDRGHQWQASWGSLWGHALPQNASHGRVAANPVQFLLGLQPCHLHSTKLVCDHMPGHKVSMPVLQNYNFPLACCTAFHICTYTP